MTRLFLPAAAALAVALAPAAAVALQPPHDASQGSGCDDCHRMHNALGTSLTTVEGSANLCQSCHSSLTDPDGKHFGFPWTERDQAAPGASGSSHRWDADVTNRGARAPAGAGMAPYLDQGKISCSTCHNAHHNGGEDPGDPFRGGRQVVGGANGGTVTVGVPFVSDAGVGRMTLATVTADALPRGYRVRISAIDGAGVRFKVSHDRGKTWFAWDGSAWVVDTGGTGVGRLAPAGTAEAVDLDDGANVRVGFPDAAAIYPVNAYWDFWISYPLLRVRNDDDAMCYDCHADRVHGRTQVEGLDASLPPNGSTSYSHPVDAPLDPARNHRVVARDADGSADDGDPSNDLVLVGGVVRCTTCHAVHNADSNSLTPDR